MQGDLCAYHVLSIFHPRTNNFQSFKVLPYAFLESERRFLKIVGAEFLSSVSRTLVPVIFAITGIVVEHSEGAEDMSISAAKGVMVGGERRVLCERTIYKQRLQPSTAPHGLIIVQN
jgi:hypothetical protein